MKKRIAIVSGLLLSSPAWATGMFQPDGVQPIDPSGYQGPQRVELPPDPEGKAEELRLHGKCDQAIPILRTLAANEHDDIAQFNLGQCLVDLSKGNHNPALAQEGVQWILKTANKGLPNAQLSLVTIYLNGDGVAQDLIEAGKWSLLYHSNGTRLAIGMQDIPDALQARLDGTLTDTAWSEAQKRASDWMPAEQSAEE